MLDWWGPVIHEYYAGTEGNGFCYAAPTDWLAHKGTVGKPINCEVHIVDDEGNEVPIGDEGGVYFGASPAGFEYHNDPEEDDGLHPGAWVHHELLGRGCVNAVQGYGAARRITVRFENGDERQLVVAYAPLSVISPPDEEWEAC